jgi:hypothetical protein
MYGVNQMRTDLKFALVKQTSYNDLYCCPLSTVPIDVPMTSRMRSGPVALFTKHNSDFYIVDVEDTPECGIWNEKISHCNHDSRLYTNVITTQKDYSVNVNDINWGKYDCVISLDISIPTHVVKKYPNTYWAYYITEGAMPEKRKSVDRLIDGYDQFFNLRSSNHEPCNNEWESNFPYHLQYYGCFNDIGIPIIRSSVLPSYHICHHDKDYLFSKGIKSDLGNMIYNSAGGSIRALLTNLSSCKYYIKFSDRQVWGNSTIEAISAGCLVLTQSVGNGSRDLAGQDCIVNSYQELIDKIKYFESDFSEYNRCVTIQRQNIDQFCYNQPMSDLIDKIKTKRMCAMNKIKFVLHPRGRSGFMATIYSSDESIIKKVYSDPKLIIQDDWKVTVQDLEPHYDREKKILQLFTDHGYEQFPTLLGCDDDTQTLYMSDCGEHLTRKNCPQDWKSQILTIINILDKHHLNHNDFLTKNMCVNNGLIRLIDFGWCVDKDETVAWQSNINPDEIDEDFDLFELRGKLTNG